MKLKIESILVVLLLSSTYAFAAPPVTDGLIIHLQADALTLQNGDAVSSWPDSANDSVNGTVSSVSGYGTPEYVTSAINGKPAVRFTSSELDVLASAQWTWDQTKGVTVFIVATGGSTSNQRAVQIGNTGGTVYKGFGCELSSVQTQTSGLGSGLRYNNGYLLTSNAGANPVKQNVWHLSVRQIAQGGAYGGALYSVNDITYVARNTNTSTYNMAFDASGNDILLGAGWQNNVFLEYYNGDIAEVIVYNKQLTPSQIQQVSSYLNDKYNVYPYSWGKNFTIVAVPDSQGYVEQGDVGVFENEIQYIKNNINSKNIAFVTHEGDFMTSSTDAHYQGANSGMQRLLNTIPMSMVPGNHDYDSTNPSRNSTLWNKYLGPTKDYWRDKSWYGGYASGGDSDGMSSWQMFSTQDIDFLHIAFELSPSDARLNWAQGVINAHPGWPTIVTTHSHLTAGGAGYQGNGNRAPDYPANGGQAVWDEFIKINPQIFMTLCGHSFDGDYHCSNRRTDNNTAGLPVYQMIADYQGCYSGSGIGNGGGWIRLLEVSPTTNTVRARTYSTILNKFSDDPILTNGSSYARQWAAFNYDNQGAGALYAESNTKSSTFTFPFIYGKQLPYPAQVYGEHIGGLVKSFSIAGTGDRVAGGLAFDPSYKVGANYDRIYYVNRNATGTQGLYRASISAGNSSGLLVLGSLTDPAGCAVDETGSAYVCYDINAALWKVSNPSGATTQLLGNYRAAGDDDMASVMMVPQGFGGGYAEGSDLVVIDTGIDTDDNEAVVVVRADSTAASPQFDVIWEDTGGYYTSNIKGAASEFDGFIYMVPSTIQFATVSGTVRPYINRFKPGKGEVIFLDADITRGGTAPVCDDSITVNPANGSIWLATAASTSGGLTYPRTVVRIDVQNAVQVSPGIYLAHVTPEITNLYANIGVNGMAWSPDGKYLAISCVDSDKLFIYQSAMPADCADAIAKGYGLAYDFNDDCKVNLVDFASIQIDELAQFAMQWLECIDPQTCTWIWP